MCVVCFQDKSVSQLPCGVQYFILYFLWQELFPNVYSPSVSIMSIHFLMF